MLRHGHRSLCAAILLLAACNPPPRETAAGPSSAGASGGPSTSEGSGGAPASQPCQGRDIPVSDLPVSKDGLSVVVGCSGQSLTLTAIDPAIVRLAYDLQ